MSHTFRFAVYADVRTVFRHAIGEVSRSRMRLYCTASSLLLSMFFAALVFLLSTGRPDAGTSPPYQVSGWPELRRHFASSLAAGAAFCARK